MAGPPRRGENGVLRGGARLPRGARGPGEFIAERTRRAMFPALAQAVPELRDAFFYRGCFSTGGRRLRPRVAGAAVALISGRRTALMSTAAYVLEVAAAARRWGIRRALRWLWPRRSPTPWARRAGARERQPRAQQCSCEPDAAASISAIARRLKSAALCSRAVRRPPARRRSRSSESSANRVTAAASDLASLASNSSAFTRSRRYSPEPRGRWHRRAVPWPSPRVVPVPGSCHRTGNTTTSAARSTSGELGAGACRPRSAAGHARRDRRQGSSS